MVRPRSTRPALSFLAVAVVVVLALSACGTSSPATEAGDDRSATTGSIDATASTDASNSTQVPDDDSGPAGPATPVSGLESWDVDGVTRTARLVVPDDLSQPAPLVLAYHGHGGTGANMQRKMDIEAHWPEAIVVYPDGLVGHKGRTDPEGERTGWQQLPDDEGGRDLRFFDVMMADLRSRLPIDPQRIFVVGHSNGSAFTSLLLNQRGDQIAATANLAGQPGRLLATDPLRSMFMMMGEQDPIVPYEGQRRSIPLAEAKLGVDPAAATVDGYLRREDGPDGLELATYIHPGGHEVPPEVPPLVVAFFQRHHLGEGA